jgi:transporter family-2 protein
MSLLLVSVIVGLLGGVAIGLQNPLASQMGQRVGILEGAFIIHLGGALLAGMPLALLRGGGLGQWREVPWYALWAGGLGVVLICAVSYTIPRIGLAATVSLVVAAQLTIGALLDHLGILGLAGRPLDLPRLAGIALLLLGAWLVLR